MTARDDSTKAKLSQSQVAGLVVGGPAIGLIGFVILFRHWFDAHSGAASWVQAIGAIAIVWATAWIAGLNYMEDRNRRRESERQLWEAVAAMSERCIECLYEIVAATENSAQPNTAFLNKYRPSDLDAPLEGLAAVPLHELGNVLMVQAVISLRRVMGRVRTELDDQYRHLTSQSVTRGLNVQALGNYKVEAFNAHASIMRLTYPIDAQEKLRRF